MSQIEQINPSIDTPKYQKALNFIRFNGGKGFDESIAADLGISYKEVHSLMRYVKRKKIANIRRKEIYDNENYYVGLEYILN